MFKTILSWITSLTKQQLWQGNIQEEAIFYDERPFRIDDDRLKSILHRSVVAMTFENIHKKIGAGSGVLISKDIVLTAAHNIYSRQLMRENSDFKIYLEANGVGKDPWEVESYIYPDQYRTCQKSNKFSFDYAIMKLKRPTKFNKFMPLSLACKQCLMRNNKQTQLKIYGFPREYPRGHPQYGQSFYKNFDPIDKKAKQRVLYQYGLDRKNKIVKADNVLLCYGISTLPGQSGSPVVVKNSIIAVHVGGDQEQYNIGRVVNYRFINNLLRWADQLKADPFQLKTRNLCPHIEQTLEKTKLNLLLSMCNMKNLDLSKYSNLLELNLSYNKFAFIDISSCYNLRKVNLRNNRLNEIDLTNNTNLTHLQLSDNRLQDLDVSNSKNLTHLYLWNNQLQTLDVTQNARLICLNLHNNRLWKINIRSNQYLSSIYLSSNQLTQINFSDKDTILQRMWLQENKLRRVSLLISEKVDEAYYEGIDERRHQFFNISNQSSYDCRVQLKCHLSRNSQ